MENTRKLKMAPLERSLVVDFESYMNFKNMCISNCGKSGEIDIKDSPSYYLGKKFGYAFNLTFLHFLIE